MGTFRVEVQAVGGHGCQREVKSGETITAPCGHASCPDCLAREFVQKLKAAGCFFNTTGTIEGVGYAKLTHWPHGHGTVSDDLLTGVRSGNF